jgi:TolB-like protein/DNA-binding winged helix-turn-helix (wHTH) protein
MSTLPTATYRFDRFTLDLARGCLREGDREIKLRRKAFDVLTYLVKNAGRLLSKDELMQATWPGIFVSDDSLVQCIKEIRHALDDGAQLCIKTSCGRGYLFAAPVSVVDPLAPGQSERRRAPSLRGRLRTVLCTANVIAVGGVALICTGLAWWMLGSPSPALLAAQAGTHHVGTAPARLSVVVLPFMSLSGDPGQEHFADGLTDNLTTDLSTRISGLLVTARSSAFAYKGNNEDVAQIARDLGVRYVLEGSVQQSGNQVRVNAQLIDARTGTYLWAERFDAENAELFTLQDRITGRIASSLATEFMPAAAREAE